MSTVYIRGQRLTLSPSQKIGEGGEAEVLDIGSGQVLKLFKQPNHPDFAGSSTERAMVRERLAAHQRKLPAFPKNLPSQIIAPLDLATGTATGSTIVGYTMKFLRGGEVLWSYGQKDFRQKNAIGNQSLMPILRKLYHVINEVHPLGVIIGDNNDLNWIVIGDEIYLIDADSIQFGSFLCQLFTAKFVDPLLCDPKATSPQLIKPHNPNSDWYAFCIMLMQSLLFVGPYGGVYRPKNLKNRISPDARSLHRISVFHPEVIYPKPAIHYRVLPDDLLHFLLQTFEKDQRGKPPLSLLDNLHWTKCLQCGTEHARNSCPNCAFAAPSAIKLVTRVRGKVTATRIFQTKSGVIVFAAMQNGKLRWLYYEGGQFKRENEAVVVRGTLSPQMHFGIHGHTTLIGQDNQLTVLSSDQSIQKLPVDNPDNTPAFSANEKHYYLVSDGQLKRSGQFGLDYIGDVLTNQTRFWVGPSFGFGFYRAGGITRAFVFDAQKQGIKDTVQIPPIRGKMIDAICYFTRDRCWFLTATQQGSKIKHQCSVILADGTIEASCEAEENDGSWLGTLKGKCAINNYLLVATDDGIIRVTISGNQISQDKEFPDTEPFVDANSILYPGPEGLYAINGQEIYLLKIA